MKPTKHQNTIFVVGVCLLVISAIYVFFGGNSTSIFAYPVPSLATDSILGYPVQMESSQTLAVESMSSYPPPDPPSVLPTPTASPTPNPGMLNTTTALIIRENGAPDYHMVSPGIDQIPGLTVTTMSLTYDGPLPGGAPIEPESQSANSNLVDNWDLLAQEDFEGLFPDVCGSRDLNYGIYERFWWPHTYRPLNGIKAAWPAAGGADAVDPSLGVYPDNLNTWLVCGPFDLSQAEKFIVQYSFWLEILDTSSDHFFSGVSTDGFTFQGQAYTGFSGGWITQREHIIGVAGQPRVWFGWAFESDSGGYGYGGEGAWIDDIQVWRYNAPSVVCGNADPGNKGIVLPPYDPTANGEVPIIRPGDTLAVDVLKAAGVDWVRLGFIHDNGSIDWQGYDRMVDTLCANGISVQGLVNHETLSRTGYNDDATAEAYRQNFSEQAKFIADYYEGRITYWEVWNEPNLAPELGGAFVRSDRYARLLDETYQAIKQANPQAKVLFGGLASAWGDSNDYFAQVYSTAAGIRQFDYFAVHPYANEIYGPNPEIYMYANLLPGEFTIVDKFMRTMSSHTQGNKRAWITEVGWNSSKGLPDRPICHDPVLVTEAEQAAYLKPMFDTLFNEVTLWNQTTLAVEKVIWYQYMDVRINDVCKEGQAVGSRAYAPLAEMSTLQNEDLWLYGLYRSDKVTPKPVQCAFLAYPNDCQQVFLPAALKP